MMFDIGLSFNGQPLEVQLLKNNLPMFRLRDVADILKMHVQVPKWLEDQNVPKGYIFNPDSAEGLQDIEGYWVASDLVHALIARSLELAPLPIIHAFKEFFEKTLISIEDFPHIPNPLVDEDQGGSLQGQQYAQKDYMSVEESNVEVQRIALLMQAFEQNSSYLEEGERSRIVKYIFESLMGKPVGVRGTNGSGPTSPTKGA